jgi:hypothetical protein
VEGFLACVVSQDFCVVASNFQKLNWSCLSEIVLQCVCAVFPLPVVTCPGPGIGRCGLASPDILKCLWQKLSEPDNSELVLIILNKSMRIVASDSVQAPLNPIMSFTAHSRVVRCAGVRRAV